MTNETLAFHQTPRFRTLMVSAIVILAGLFIWQVNAAATAGFTMRDLEKDIESISMENKRLEMQVAELRSVESVTKRVKMLGLVEAGTVTYVNGDSAVAVSR